MTTSCSSAHWALPAVVACPPLPQRISIAQIKQHPWFLRNLPEELRVSHAARCAVTAAACCAARVEKGSWGTICFPRNFAAAAAAVPSSLALLVDAHPLRLPLQDGGLAMTEATSAPPQTVEDIRRIVNGARTKGAPPPVGTGAEYPGYWLAGCLCAATLCFHLCLSVQRGSIPGSHVCSSTVNRPACLLPLHCCSRLCVTSMRRTTWMGI